MANSIALLMGIQHTRTSPQSPVNYPTRTITITQSGNVVWSDTVTINTSATTITPGSVATLGVMIVENLDAANFIKVAVDDGGTPKYWGKVKAGEAYPIRLLPGTTVKMIADTAAVKVQIQIYED